MSEFISQIKSGRRPTFQEIVRETKDSAVLSGLSRQRQTFTARLLRSLSETRLFLYRHVRFLHEESRHASRRVSSPASGARLLFAVLHEAEPIVCRERWDRRLHGWR